MQLQGSVTIMASQDEVWKFITDPNAVSKCAPGLESLEIIVPDKKFKVVAGVGFGAVKVAFDTNIEFLELDAPNLAKIKAHGTAPGSAVDAISEMKLTPIDDKSTKLDWTADVVVVGTIASLASRMMVGVTKKLSEVFFDCVKQQIEI